MIQYQVVYEKTKTGYSAYVPDIPGVIATGKTKPIVEKNIFEAIQFHLEESEDLNLYDSIKKKKENSIPLQQYLLERKRGKSG